VRALSRTDKSDALSYACSLAAFQNFDVALSRVVCKWCC
jgi:hypothetical protein